MLRLDIKHSPPRGSDPARTCWRHHRWATAQISYRHGFIPRRRVSHLSDVWRHATRLDAGHDRGCLRRSTAPSVSHPTRPCMVLHRVVRATCLFYSRQRRDVHATWFSACLTISPPPPPLPSPTTCSPYYPSPARRWRFTGRTRLDGSTKMPAATPLRCAHYPHAYRYRQAAASSWQWRQHRIWRWRTCKRCLTIFGRKEHMRLYQPCWRY